MSRKRSMSLHHFIDEALGAGHMEEDTVARIVSSSDADELEVASVEVQGADIVVYFEESDDE